MKTLKRLLSLIIMIPIMFLVCACGEKSTDGGDGAGSQTSPSGGQGQESAGAALTVSECFSGAYLIVDNFLLGYSSEDVFETEYSDEIRSNINVLRKVFEVENLEYGNCFSGNKVEVDDETTQVNQVKKLKVQQVDAVDTVTIRASLIMGYEGMNINYSYKFYYFEIVANKQTKDVSFGGYFESSKQKGTVSSTAKVNGFIASGNLSDVKSIDKFEFYKMDRTAVITNASNQTVNNNTIENFEGSVFEKEKEDVFFDKSTSNENLANSNSAQSKACLSVMQVIVSQHNSVNTSGVAGVNLSASELLVPVVNL